METAEGHNCEKDVEISGGWKRKLLSVELRFDGLEDKLRKQETTIEEYWMNVKREETVAREEYKRVPGIDAHRAATNEIDELKVKIDKLQQENWVLMIEMHEKKIGELQASIDRLNPKHCGCIFCTKNRK